MKFKVLTFRARKEKLIIPHRWFAWHPVRVNDTHVAWLETVIRKGIPYHSMSGSGIDWNYKSIDENEEKCEHT